MTHLVLARKYRPKSFDQVVGQDLIVATLKASIEKNRVAHALLFTGGRGIGKTTIARIVAKALVCLNPIHAEPCGACAECSAVDNFSSLDVVEIDGASHTGVDDIRDLRESARYQPTSAKYKIFIIDEVHMLSISAFNALLKILEEPPPHVMFIFATTEAHKIPKTIISRCQRYDFKRVSIDTIFGVLKKITTTEGYVIEDEGLRLIAKLADGGLRDALSMTDQIVNGALENYSAEHVAHTLGVVSHAAVKDMCQALMDGDVTSALLIIKDVYEKGLDLCHLMDSITERFRVLSLCAHVQKEKVSTLIPLLEENDFDVVKNYDKADLKRLFAMAIDNVAQVFSSPKPLLALELFSLRAALRPALGDAVTINYCLQKLDAIMHNRPLPKVVQQKKTPEYDVVSTFASLIEQLASSSPSLASHLRHARPQLHDGDNKLTLTFEHSLHYEEVMAQVHDAQFTALLKKIFGNDTEIFLQLKKSAQPSSSVNTVAEAETLQKEQQQKALYERAHNNPLVKKALQIFGGDITEVKKINKHPV